MFKWLFHILIFATIDGSGKYNNKEMPLKCQRKLRVMNVVGTQKKRLNETIPLSTQNMCLN